MADCQIIAFHGWGFAGHDWDKWKRTLSDYGKFQAFDRGYFQDPQSVRLSNDRSPTVLISHSFGLHLIGNSQLEQANLLVITGGFLHFHPYAAQYKRRSRLILQEMINNMEVNPEEVLQKFYQNCYAPQENPDRNLEMIDHQLLLDDLQALHNSQIDTEMLKKADKICILHGSNDHIVPNKKGREIYSRLPDQTKYFEIKGAGHALPFTHGEQCLEFLLPEITQYNTTNL